MDYYDTETYNPDMADILMCRISSQLSTHNWSLKILADKSGVPYETIKKIANGKISNPSLKSILKISVAFGCSIDYLAGKESLPAKPDTAANPMYSYLN
nr:helix-turn-helix transcriptional regulator [uncultured Eisenbergiella sp.]